MGIRYDRTEWENEKTPVNQDNMNNIELGIVNATDAINKLLDGILPAARAIADEDGNNLKMTLINKADLIDGKVPANQLPSYVSNIVEVDTYEDLPNPGEGSTIYVVKNPVETTYRWTGSTYISTDEQSQYYSVKIDTSNIITMGDLHDYITSINSSGLHCFFDLSDFVENAYICTILMFTKNLINYCLIFDVINGKTYIDYNGYQTTDLVQDYVNRTGDNVPRIISLNDSNLLVRDIANLLTEINIVGHHVLFDLHELQSNCYLCTILIDTQNNQITIVDIVGFRTITRNYDEYATLVSLLEDLEPAGGGGAEIIPITYTELLALKTGGNLSPGTKYRITDFVTTCTSATTLSIQSAGHQFDIIVTALSENILDVNAKACLHEGDTYFANTDFSKWELKYDLTGSLAQYEWIDTTSNTFRGVIFHMKDEWENEAPVDFKNVMTKGNKFYMYNNIKWYAGSDRSFNGNYYYYLFTAITVQNANPTQADLVDGTLTGRIADCKVGAYTTGTGANLKYKHLNSIYFCRVYWFTARALRVDCAYNMSIALENYANTTPFYCSKYYGFCHDIFIQQTAPNSIYTNCNNIKVFDSQCSYLKFTNCTNILTGFNSKMLNMENCSYIDTTTYGSTYNGIAYSTLINCNNIHFKDSYAGYYCNFGKNCKYIDVYGEGSLDVSDNCGYLTIGNASSSSNPKRTKKTHIYIKYVAGLQNKVVQIIGSFADNFEGSIVYEGLGGTLDSSGGFPQESTYADYKIVATLTTKNDVKTVYQYDTTLETWTDITKHLYRHCISVKNQNSQIWLTFELTLESATAITNYNNLRDIIVEDINYLASGMFTSNDNNFNYVTTIMYFEKHIYNGSIYMAAHGNSIKFSATTNEYAGIVNDHGILKSITNTDTISDTVEQIY